VPRDFVVDAISYLSGREDSLGKTYQLSDHAPPTCAEALEIIAHATAREVVRVPLSVAVAKTAIERVPGVYRLMQIPSSLVDYMAHPTHYFNRATRAELAAGGIEAPRFADYAPRLADFVRQNLALGSAAMA
jgi:hypothetical protein